MGNKTALEKKENGFHSKESDPPDLKKLRKSGSTKKVDSKKSLLKDSKRKEASQKKIEKLFDKYKCPETNVIESEGIMNLIKDLQISLDDVCEEGVQDEGNET